MKARFCRVIELVLMITGLVLIAIFVVAHVHRHTLSWAAMEQFKAAAKQPAPAKTNSLISQKRFGFDFTLWSNDRISAYEQSLTRHFEPPVAVLRIAKVNLEVPVLSGTDDLTLDRGVGLIESSARPGETGNIAIAGHRDGFFRVLKNVGTGDFIELETPDKINVYRVNQVVIVRPDDVSVLQPTAVPILTLVTCYPFYFIGSAPKRYIIQASLINSGRRPSAEQSEGTSSAHLQSAPQNSNPQLQPRR